jgi:hypothetical protein
LKIAVCLTMIFSLVGCSDGRGSSVGNSIWRSDARIELHVQRLDPSRQLLFNARVLEAAGTCICTVVPGYAQL